VQYTVISGFGFGVYLLAVGTTSLFFSSQRDYVMPALALIMAALLVRPLYRRMNTFMDRAMPLKPRESEDGEKQTERDHARGFTRAWEAGPIG